MILGLALAWAAILVGCWLGWQVLRQNGRILVRLDELEKRRDELEFGEHERPAGLPVGSEAPPFELADLASERKSLAQFRGQPLLLIFFNPDCGYCRELVPQLKEVLQDSQRSTLNAQPLTVIIISTGGVEANHTLFGEQPLGYTVLLQQETVVAAAYKANGTPSGYLVDPDGRLASELAMGAEALLALASAGDQPSTLNSQPRNSDHPASAPSNGGNARTNRFRDHSLARSRINRDGLKTGTPAPDFRLPRLDGWGDLSLLDLRGRRVLLVFSSPHCGPCNTLAPHLEKFHREHPNIEVVMISKGEPKENRAKVKEHGLTFPIVLQQQWEISRRYAMFATPIAYLIDEAGVIAHDVAVGTDAILGLLAKRAGQGDKINRMEVQGVGLLNDVPV